MKTITTKEMRTLVTLANKSARIARAHTEASNKFAQTFDKIVGVRFDCTPSGLEDPIADIIDYGTGTDLEDLTNLIAQYCEDIKHEVLFE